MGVNLEISLTRGVREALYKGEKESMGDSLSLSPLYVCSWLRGYMPIDHNA